MKFRSSPKVFKSYKSDYPQKTIREARKFLKKRGINLNCLIVRAEKDKFKSYVAQITHVKEGGEVIYVASGKGLTKDLCLASAYAETIERILSRMSPLNSILGIEIKEDEKNDDNFVNALSFPYDGKKHSIPIELILEAGTNGLAAGNSIEEAFSQAFCEICERFSLQQHITKRISGRTVDKKTIKNRKIISFIKFFESINHDVKIKDMTLDNNIPVIGVLFTNNNVKGDGVKKKVFFKELQVASHFNLEEAIIRCFTEKIQADWGNIRRMLDPGKFKYNIGGFTHEIEIFDRYYTEKENEIVIKKLKEPPLFTIIRTGRSIEDFDFLEKGEIVSINELRDVKTKDFLEDINESKKILKRNKWNCFFINHSIIKEVSINVVRIIIPSVSNNFYKRIDQVVVDEMFIKNLKEEERYNFLKYIILPRILLEWPFSFADYIYLDTKIKYTSIIKELFELSKSLGKEEEQEKIEKISQEIIRFNLAQRIVE